MGPGPPPFLIKRGGGGGNIGILYNWAAHSPFNRSCDPDTGQVTADEGHVMTTKGQVH